MNRSQTFVSKVLYIAAIVALLIPLSMLARPATRRKLGEPTDPGGKLASLRYAYDLSQAKLGEVDPASETMKLMSLGFRSVAASSLWAASIDAKDKKDWDRFAAALNTLIKIQPNFVKVWEYQAHNMSYNVSSEFDDFELRYNWVKKGLELLVDGLAYNRLDHRFTDNLGWFTGQKIGRSDEKVEYRRLFRADHDYHATLDPFFDRDSYDAGEYGQDHWLLAYQWYDFSVRMVEQGIQGEKAKLRKDDLIFYMWKPAQLRNHVASLQTEFPPEESFKFKWLKANSEWREYGRRTVHTSFQLPLTLEGLVETEIEQQRLRAELDLLAPGVRAQQMEEAYRRVSVSPEQEALLKQPIDSLTDDQQQMARNVRLNLEAAVRDIDDQVAAAAPPESRQLAAQLLLKLKEVMVRMRMIDKYRNTSQYHYWNVRTKLEATDEALDAHQAKFDADDHYRNAVYADYQPLDPSGGGPQLDDAGQPRVERGAISNYVRMFAFWAESAKTNLIIEESAFYDTILEDAERVHEMLIALGRPWMEDFPLQDYLKRNPATARRYGLPVGGEPVAEPDGLPERPDLNLNADG